ncbi:MAG TPA: hypothetical protein VIV40_21145 [Kofleriaceae bacterium]
MDRADEADERWRDVFCEIVERAKCDAEFRARVEATGAIISNFDAVLTRNRADHAWTRADHTPPAPGTIACREYWWGFQLEIPHDFLRDRSATEIEPAHITAAIAMRVGPSAAFVRRIAAWAAHRFAELQERDVGAGVYASMTWMAPNIFLVTPIRDD